MSHDAMNSWLDKQKNTASAGTLQSSGVRVVKRDETKTRGAAIMEIAEKIRPWLMKMFDGVRDDEGMLLQPANIRGISLNVAQNLMRNQEQRIS